MKESATSGRSVADPYGTTPLALPEPETVSGCDAESKSLHDALFGRLAVLNGFVDQGTLDQAIRQQKTKHSASLADILVQIAALSEKSRQAIELLLEAHAAKHGDDLKQSLSALGAVSTRSLSPPNSDETATFIPKPGNGQPPHKRFGDYELLGEIARGGMGVVYKARQAKLNRLVALKMIRSGELADDEQVKRFYTEAEAAAKLDHPGIVPVYEVGEANGQHFFSMALVVGTSLNERVKNDGPLPPKDAARLLKLVVEAVEYAHGKGIIHRDIKPQNILLDAAGQPRLTDFGLAKQVMSQSDLTATGQVMGTPSYMPPEQASGKLDEIGTASDVYSLGATLYFVLTGRPPFQTASAAETIQQVLNSEPVALRRLNPGIPRDLDTICLKCLEKRVGDRYESAVELAADLRRYLEGDPINARPHGYLRDIWHWSRRPQRVPQAAGIILIISAFYGLFAAAGICGLLFGWVRPAYPAQAAIIVGLDFSGFAFCLPIGLGILAAKRWLMWGGLLVGWSMTAAILTLICTGFEAGGLLSDPFQRGSLYLIFGFVGIVMIAACVVAVISHSASEQSIAVMKRPGTT